MRSTLFLFSLLTAASTAEAAPAVQPNVLFIAYDDLKPMLGAYGNSQDQSPNLDRLAARGVVFLNAACQFPVCGPSRASLLTGQRPETTGVLDLKTKMRDVNPDVLTLPQHFKNHGYTTAGIGKIFDPRCVDSRLQGDAPSWSIPYAENPRFGVAILETWKGGPEGGTAAVGNVDAPDEAFPDGNIARHAIGQLRTFAAEEKPFFLAVGFKKPHLPFVAPKRHWDRYDRTQITLAAFQEETAAHSGYGYWNSNEIRGYENIPKTGRFPDELQRELLHGYMACISWVDELTGRLVAELDQLGLRDNTIIVLWGDHGFHLGDHGLWGKHTPFEEAVRAPLIIIDPRSGGRPQRVVSPVDFIDIFPTLCDLSALPKPAQLQGVTLAPNLTDANYSARKFNSSIYRSKGALGYSIRTERYRYIEWIDQTNAQLVARDLFDFNQDPDGRKNVADDPAYQEIVRDLSILLKTDTGGWTLLSRHLSQPRDPRQTP
jgi:arylsulfatase A-like enzyme